MLERMFDRFFDDEPTNDPAIRIGRWIGTILGLALYPFLAWVALQGMF